MSYRELLLQRQNEILRRNSEITPFPSAPWLEEVGDIADASVLDTNADYFLALAEKDRRELLEIREALARIQKGTYGLCMNCENPIEGDRLNKIPDARYCIDCQSAMEARYRTARLRTMPKL
jgi:DnaK suppressor protein